MRTRSLVMSFLLLISFAASAFAADPSVEFFSPQGEVKTVRQVNARFSEQMVPFGDPRILDPFDISCPEKGRGRWADGKNWVYDFDRDLPAGVVCSFAVKPDLKTLAGAKVSGQKFTFSTGGPAIRRSNPYEGSWIDEEQVFILSLDAPAKEDTVLEHASCAVEGIADRFGVRIITGKDRSELLKTQGQRYRYGLSGEGVKAFPPIVLQCKQRFPNSVKMQLIWGKGIESTSGVPTSHDQTLTFRVRDPFRATFNCDRENEKADCIPILPLTLNFSSPVSRSYAEKIVMKGPKNAVFRPLLSRAEDTGNEEAMKDEFVRGVTFAAPLPPLATFSIELPKDIRDDAGRQLSNAGKFPLTVRTADYPPLAKFAADFGIIERADPLLPVTLRNVEAEVKARMLNAEDVKNAVEKTAENVSGAADRVAGAIKSLFTGQVTGKVRSFADETDVMVWLDKVESKERPGMPLLTGPDTAGRAREFTVPKPNGAKAFEVVGVPLKEPGFYVVELESRILGESLLGEPKPYYATAAALVTNLSAHFKQGRESSLVWVTTLDKAEPVKDAKVTVRDCEGTVHWEGTTDAYGVASIDKELPDESKLPRCRNWNMSGYYVFAKTADDMTFVRSTWDNGIETWRFNLPHADYRGPVIAHTILDRTLFRAGETVSMKHIIRKHVMAGFAQLRELPKAVLIRHEGSDQRYEFPLTWDANGVAESTWAIPKDAKLGTYSITLLKKGNGKQRKAVGGYEAGDEEYFNADGWESGSFRVEEFRVPLMKGIIQPPKEPIVNAKDATVDLFVKYLSGGGAGGAAVKLRTQVAPKFVSFEQYENFVFANGEVKEGVTGRDGREYYGSEEDEEEGPEGYGDEEEAPRKVQPAQAGARTSELTLDMSGALRTKISDLPLSPVPQDLQAEMEFRDPNGEVQTVSTRIPLWPSNLLVGIKPDAWVASKDSYKFFVRVVDLAGRPVANRAVAADLFQRRTYSHRKRLIGGFYAYESSTETKKLMQACEGKTDAKGLLICESKSPVSGNVIIQARTKDDSGNISVAHRDIWIADKGEWWFDVSDSDRIDLLPETKHYEPGETAKFQVRMPFREATALVTVEREGVMERFVQKLSGTKPVVEVPVKGNYAPNVFVSVLVVRGRVGDPKATALIDLGRPAYKLGIAEINVGWRAHELRVFVQPEKQVYRIRDKAKVRIKVLQRDPKNPWPPKDTEVAIAAVDEGLLELMPNKSWDLLAAMMGQRGYEVRTSTAQMQVIGKRHYGLKAYPSGGGGGRSVTREMFDTLLLWKGKVRLNEIGQAVVEIPLNDSLTSFRIAAVANADTGLFGSGEASIRTTQDLMLLSGLPPVVREGDRFRAGFTVRNASDRKMDVEVSAALTGSASKPEPKTETLAAGEARELFWDTDVPVNGESLVWEVTAKEKNGAASDRLKVTQKIVEAVQARVYQATIAQIEKPYTLSVERPKDALPGKGGVKVSFRKKLSNGMGGVTWYMQQYPYTCMEQRTSRAIALRDESLWKKAMADLPTYMDSDGLVKYFPTCLLGSDTLTAYMLAISNEAGWEIPGDLRDRMLGGLRGFIEGRVIRWSSLPTADVSIRKMAALEALSRYNKAEPRLLGPIAVEPNLWPTSAVIDWMNVLIRVPSIPDDGKRLSEAEQILRSRLNFQGTTMGFSTEKTDYYWWLMISGDVNAVRTVLTFLDRGAWKEDMPRLVRGALGRQYHGYWSTTVANAWGVLAMEKFSKKFENVPVTGATSARIGNTTKSVDWKNAEEGASVMFGWPPKQSDLVISHQGSGKPWATVQSIAAIPLKEPFSSGYRIKKTVTPVEQKKKGVWSRGDVARVKLELESQADMTWVVVNDPIPAGATILGSGLGGDSGMLTKGEKGTGWAWPVFTERSFTAYRAYYEYVAKGPWSLEYTVRLNTGGSFELPETRVEALYAPEMFGESPNGKMEVGD